MNETRITDRRRFRRYPLKGDVYIMLMPHPDIHILGRLHDISIGGASFEYVAFEQVERIVDAEIDIFACKPDHFLLRSLPCKVVYEIEADTPTFAGIETWRCGLRFEQLTQMHSEQLKVLLDDYMSYALTGQYVGSDRTLPLVAGEQ